MFVLLIIVVLAILALWMSHQERKRPAALFMMGLLCMILGGRAVVVLSNSYTDTYWDAVYGDEDSPPGTVPASDGDRGDTVESTNKSAEAVASHKDNARPHELTIEPTPSFRYLTMPRPEWVETEVTKSDEFYQVPVESGLHFRKLTAQKSLRDEVKAAVDKYVNDYLESELASSLAGYSIEENESGATRTISLRLEGETYEIAHERFDEQVEFDYGVMNQSHALVKLDKQLQAALDQRWSKVRANIQAVSNRARCRSRVAVVGNDVQLLEAGHGDARLLHRTLAVWGGCGDTGSHRCRCRLRELDSVDVDSDL